VLAHVGVTRPASGRCPVYRTPFTVLVPSCLETSDTADITDMANTAGTGILDTMADITAVMAEATMDGAGAGSLLSSEVGSVFLALSEKEVILHDY
jgi:hypothetical protein